jgi:hypothetical protein
MVWTTEHTAGSSISAGDLMVWTTEHTAGSSISGDLPLRCNTKTMPSAVHQRHVMDPQPGLPVVHCILASLQLARLQNVLSCLLAARSARAFISRCKSHQVIAATVLEVLHA